MKGLKKSFGFFLVIFVLSAFWFVGAGSLEEDYSFLEDPENALIELHPGWNLVPSSINVEIGDYFPSHENKACFKGRAEEISSFYIYDPLNNKYIKEWNYEDIRDYAGEYWFASDYVWSFWVYVDEESSCYARVDEDLLAYEEVAGKELLKGWNFISITPSMIGKSFEDIQGTCEYGEIYAWDSESQEWTGGVASGDLFDEFLLEEEIIGFGLIVKVKEDCELNLEGGFEDSSLNSGIPSLPSEEEGDDESSDKNLIANGFIIKKEGTDVNILLDYEEEGLDEKDNYYVNFYWVNDAEDKLELTSIISKAVLERDGFELDLSSDFESQEISEITVIASMDYSFIEGTSWEHHNMISETNEDELDNCIMQKFQITNIDLAPEQRDIVAIDEPVGCGS